jgi:hypothetical protein
MMKPGPATVSMLFVALELCSCSRNEPMTEMAIAAWEKSYAYSHENVRVVSFKQRAPREWRVNGTIEHVMVYDGVIEYRSDVSGPFNSILHRKGERVREHVEIPFVQSGKGWVVDEPSIQLARRSW